MRYRSSDVYDYLTSLGCTFEGDRFPIGEGWLTKDQHIFILPDPVLDGDGYWFDADVIDAILVDRWIMQGPMSLTRHP